MKEKKEKMKNHSTYEVNKKIRKNQPPTEKIIQPKTNYKREQFNWKKEMEDMD